MSNLTQDYLKSLIEYDTETGIMKWKVKRQPNISPGDICGCIKKRPSGDRWVIKLDGKPYFRSRLAWLYVHGYMPLNFIDHKNRNSLDDRIENLREATISQNNTNKKKYKNNSSGTKGVHYKSNRDRWIARIGINGKRIERSCKTKEEAIACCEQLSQEYHGDFGNPE